MPLPLRARAVTEALVAKGMERHESHHTMFRRRVDGVTTLVTRVSHGATDIGANLATAMAHQCALQLAEFQKLVDCTLSADEWDAIVRERCASGRNPLL